MLKKKKASISQVSLPFSNLKNLDLRLNWVGECRRHPEDSSRIELFTRFIGTTKSLLVDCWIGLEYLPFLITGSNWANGSMVSTPLAVMPFSLPCGFHTRWLVPGCDDETGIDLQAVYPIRLHRPAAAVLEVTTANNELLYLPNHELLRAHYFFSPRSIPSLLGGLLIYRHLASSSLQAWHYPKTCWADESKGIAQFHRAKFLTDYQSKCLSRLLFDSNGIDSVKRLHHWAQSSFIERHLGRHTELRADLPRLALPYPQAEWSAAVSYMGSNKFGQHRYLVLQLHSFSAPEPYKELRILSDDDPKETSVSELSIAEPTITGGKILQPLPEDPLDLVEEASCGSFAPVFMADVLPIDRASQLRTPLKRQGTNDGNKSNKRKPTTGSKRASKGSILGPGNNDEKTAPLIPSEMTDDWPVRHEGFNEPAKVVSEVLLKIKDRHDHIPSEVRFKFLPNEQQCYSFEVLTAGRLTRGLRYFRQFLLAEIVIGSRCAYIVDAQQRSRSENFPIGVIWRRAGQAAYDDSLNNEDFELVAKCFEHSRRDGFSWTTHAQLTSRFHLVNVRHAPRHNPVEKDLISLKERLFQAVMLSIGDPRAQE